MASEVEDDFVNARIRAIGVVHCLVEAAVDDVDRVPGTMVYILRSRRCEERR